VDVGLDESVKIFMRWTRRGIRRTEKGPALAIRRQRAIHKINLYKRYNRIKDYSSLCKGSLIYLKNGPLENLVNPDS